MPKKSVAPAAPEDPVARAKEQAQAQYASIYRMIARLQLAREKDDDQGEIEAAEQAIYEDPLSVEVRSGWYMPHGDKADREPQEYVVLLCTGGPAVRIRGDIELGASTANLECQDWFTPWTPVNPKPIADEDPDEIMLEYVNALGGFD